MSHHPLTVEIRPDARTVTLVLAGELDLGTADTLRICLQQLGDGYDELVVDLEALHFLDSTGLGLLVATRHALAGRDRPGAMVLRNPQGNVRRVLEVSGVDQVLTVQV